MLSPRLVSCAHLCRESEASELQLCTDSSVDDFRGATGEGSRLPSDGDGDGESRWPSAGEGAESLRHPGGGSSSSSGRPASEGRTTMGGTARSPAPVRCVAVAAVVFFASFSQLTEADKLAAEGVPSSLGSLGSGAASWRRRRVPPRSAEPLRAGRPSSEMLERNKRAARLRFEFSRFLRICSRVWLFVAAPSWPQAAVAAMLRVAAPRSSAWESHSPNCQIPFYPAREGLSPCRAPIGSKLGYVMTLPYVVFRDQTKPSPKKNNKKPKQNPPPNKNKTNHDACRGGKTKEKQNMTPSFG